MTTPALHALRDALTEIIGYLRMAQGPGADPSLIAEAERAAGRAVELLDAAAGDWVPDTAAGTVGPGTAVPGAAAGAASGGTPRAPVGAAFAATILLVEDDPMVRRATTRMLDNLGYKVLAAVDGYEALAMIGADDAQVDLLMTDVVMPRMSGTELYERLCVRFPELRVLFISGYTDSVVLELGVRRGVMPYLPKPYTHDTLAAKLREVLSS